MIFELFWVFERGALLIEQNVREAIAIIDLGSLKSAWTRYDLDGMANWRSYDAERLTVDALTQRTAYIRLESATGDMALAALGKRGEPPTVLIRLELDDAALLERLLRETLTWNLPLVRAGISPVAAREAFHKRNMAMAQVGGLDIASLLSVVRRDTLDLPPSVVERLPEQEEPVPGMLLVRMLPRATMSPEEAVEHWLMCVNTLLNAGS